MRDQMKLYEDSYNKVVTERQLMADECDFMSKLTNDWMTEAIGYREQRDAAWEKIKIFEDRLPQLKREYQIKTDEIRNKYEKAEKTLMKQRDKIQSDAEVELEMK